ncbi:MAG TPA: hypothetical protein ENK32_07585 [Anaerolineae bacterium]|nr:hypothetical protein [Anaerolineae bacterium]
MKRQTILEFVLLAGILLIAAVARTGWPGLTEFKADEARLLQLALDMADFRQFPLRGISSSVGFPNFPLSVWLYALPLLLWKHVYAATLFTGLLNTLAVAGTYWLARRYWGVPAALTAALMFAVSPWAIHHSRKIWAQNLLPFLVTGWGMTAVLTFVERRGKLIILHLLFLAMAAQAHLAGLALVPATAVYLLIFRRRVNWKYTAVGLIAAGLTALPFIWYLLTAGQRYLNVEKAAAVSGAARGWDMAALQHAWRLISGWQIHALAGEAFETFLQGAPGMTAVYLFWGGLILGGLAVMLRHVWQTRRQPDQNTELYAILLLWLAAPILLFSWPRLPAELHYLLPIYPVPYLAAAIFINHLPAASHQPPAASHQPPATSHQPPATSHQWQQLALAILLVTAVAQLFYWFSLQNFLSRQATPGGFGAPLAMKLDAVNTARQQLASSGAVEVLIAGAGDNPQEDEFAAVYGTLFRDVPHRFVDTADTAVFPQGAAVVLLENAGLGGQVYLGAAGETAVIPQRRGEPDLFVLTLDGQPAPVHVFDPPPILTNWASYAGYDDPVLAKDEATAVWRVYWNAGEPSAADTHIFVHVLNEEGERTQMDTAVFPPAQWQPGDLVVNAFHIPWPENASLIRTGMYLYPSLEPILVFDAAGNPYTDAVEIEIE